MRHPPLARCLLYPALLLAVAPGCAVFPRYRPVAVLARDAETGKPIPGADVSISYPLAESSLAPAASFGKTGDDGLARLRAAPYGDEGLVVQVSAEGYMPEEKGVPVKVVEALEPAPLFATVERPPLPFVLELYAEPHPRVELVLPPGFRGTIKAEVQVREDLPCPPGQRTFSYAVSPLGEVRVTGPVLLRRAVLPCAFARYADGAALNPSARDAEVGFWWLKSEGSCQYFFVGTRSEFDMLRRSLRKEYEGDSRPPGDGKGGGRGRRNRRGDQAPADSGPSGVNP